MKKHLIIIAGFSGLISTHGYATDYIISTCFTDSAKTTYLMPCSGTATPNSNCQMTCAMYSNSSATTSTNYGIRTVSQRKIKVSCTTADDMTCTSYTQTTHTCVSGYYGTATSSSAGCTACPSNATCAGGNDSTFICNAGYMAGGSSCYQCSAGYYCPGDNTMNSCSSKTGNSSATSVAGSDAITDCYLPTSTDFSDTTGVYEYTSKCYYSE